MLQTRLPGKILGYGCQKGRIRVPAYGLKAIAQRGTSNLTMPSERCLAFRRHGLSPNRTRLFRPVFLFAGFTDTRVEAVGRVEFAVELFERGLGFIQMADVVFGGILRAALV